MATAATAHADFAFRPYSPAFVDDPYPVYRELRERFPVYRYSTFSGEQTMLSRYADCKRVLVDKSFPAEDVPGAVPAHEKLECGTPDDVLKLRKELGRWLFFMKPPAHGALRGMVSDSFTAGALEPLRAFIEAHVAAAFETLRLHGRMELMSALARPLPTATACRLLGLPVERVTALLGDIESVFKIIEQPLTVSQYRRMVGAANRLREEVSADLARKRRAPSDDLLGTLLAAHGDVGDDEELIGFVVMLMSAGQETSENYIANGIHALLRNRAQFERLCREPELVQSAALELARYDTPVQFVSRVATGDVEIRGHAIPSGSRIYLALGSANRDPERFADPEALDIARTDTGHLAFGAGAHFCLGRVLAVMQMKAILQKLIEFPRVKLVAGSAERRQTRVVRGFTKLEIAS